MSRSSHPTIGLKIKRIREMRGLKLRELGSMCGLSFSMIGRWERQESDPSWDQVCKLASALEVSPRMLWDPDDPIGILEDSERR